MLHVEAERNFKTQGSFNACARKFRMKNKRLIAMHEVTIARLNERLWVPRYDAAIGILHGLGIDSVRFMEARYHIGQGGKASRKEAVIVTQHEDVVSSAFI